ncbi:MAG: HD family phosphohydrolase [Acidobacteriota bacterium]
MKTLSAYIRLLKEPDSFAAKWALLLASALVMALMFPSSISVENEYALGTVWTDSDLYAPFSFPLYKDDAEYARERSDAAAHVYKVFEADGDIPRSSVDSLARFFAALRMVIDRRSSDSSEILRTIRMLPVSFSDAEWKTLWHLRSSERRANRVSLSSIEHDIASTMELSYARGIVDLRTIQPSGDTAVALRKKTIERIVPVSSFIDKASLGRVAEETFSMLYKGDNDTSLIASKIFLSFVSPNIQYRKEQTEAELRFAVESVPRTNGAVKEGDRIISKNERITEEAKRKLDSLRKSKIERGADVNRAATFAGKVLHAFAILWLFSMYLYLFRKAIFRNNGKLLMIAVIVIGAAVSAWGTRLYEGELAMKFLIIVPVASMLLAIVFDSRVAFYGTVVTSILAAAVRGNDYSVALCSLAAGALAVYTVRDIKKRTQLFRSISFIFIGYAISILALGLERYEAPSIVINQLLIAGVNSVVSPVLTYGILIFFERVLHVTTDLGLLDLANFNHPLLKELSMKTPGTFHHSVSISTMAEAAADAVGANPVLTRVGALYHDIGKIVNPVMFVENQLGEDNRHDVINPKRSARIISSHVADGMRLGREYGIPEEVLQFIPMHHGKTKIGFFYEQALEHSLAPETVNEKEFRYAGPRPNSKETAIVMLADAVEASTRSIEEPTAEKIDENIDQIFKSRFMEGELDESNLTLSDLMKIRESFRKILLGVYHPRLKYPEKEDGEESARTLAEQPLPLSHAEARPKQKKSPEPAAVALAEGNTVEDVPPVKKPRARRKKASDGGHSADAS